MTLGRFKRGTTQLYRAVAGGGLSGYADQTGVACCCHVQHTAPSTREPFGGRLGEDFHRPHVAGLAPATGSLHTALSATRSRH